MGPITAALWSARVSALSAEAPNMTLHPRPREMPPLRFADGNAAPTSLAALRGKVVLLNLWATWCVPCVKELPTLDRLQATLGGADFEVVALSIDRADTAVVQAFLRQTGIKTLRPYMDVFQEAMPSLGATVIPLTLLIDRDGREIGRKLGPAQWDQPQMVQLIRDKLQRTAVGRAPAPVRARADAPVKLTHVHGLSYSADGKQLMIPSHDGLAVFANGRWSKAAGPAHDYMGFSATRDALYSSGHPAPGSGLTNPFGLIKSRDGGKTWHKLGLEGESDFHTLATSYETNAVYVFNHQPNSRMSQAGIYSTRADGLQWQRADARGLDAKLNGLAVHPTDAKVVAAATDNGLYLSRDSAAHFEPLMGGARVLAAAFDLDGQHLWFSGHAGKATLARLALTVGAKPEAITLPDLPDDAVAYIAQNPLRRAEMAVATFKRSVFLSKDSGRSWTQIAKEGAGVE